MYHKAHKQEGIFTPDKDSFPGMMKQPVNPSATEEEVYAACRVATIHDRIMSFPDQYNAQVAEGG